MTYWRMQVHPGYSHNVVKDAAHEVLKEAGKLRKVR
jgi:hypothetical protein